MASLLDAGFEQEEVETSLVAYESLGDEAFESIVAAWKGKMDKMKKKDEEKKTKLYDFLVSNHDGDEDAVQEKGNYELYDIFPNDPYSEYYERAKKAFPKLVAQFDKLESAAQNYQDMDDKDIHGSVTGKY